MPVTPVYQIAYPDGSSQYAPLQTHFQAVAEGVESALIENLGSQVPYGTTVERDTYYGVPATAIDRVSLATKRARWLNTDKGYEQQYFAQYDDAGVGSAPAMPVYGWYPAASSGASVLLQRGTISNLSSGSATVKGRRFEFSGSQGFALQNVFLDDFQQYKIVVNINTVTAISDFLVQFMNGATAVGGTTYSYSWFAAKSGGITALLGTSPQTAMKLGTLENSHCRIELDIQNPYETNRQTLIQAKLSDGSNIHHYSTGSLTDNSVNHTGIRVATTATSALTGFISVYGVVS